MTAEYQIQPNAVPARITTAVSAPVATLLLMALMAAVLVIGLTPAVAAAAVAEGQHPPAASSTAAVPATPAVPAAAQRNPLVLQADFAGLVMTGVAYSVDPQLTVHNVRPLIPLYDIAAASASLADNAQSWPAGTVFVSVVDPGVGTARKSVVLKTRNGLYFVSPDNGSLSGPAADYGIAAVREIDESVNRIPGSDWSHTFHGRDVYSYTGARLAAGVIRFEEVGPLLESAVVRLTLPVAEATEDGLKGVIAGGVGRLGNAYFNIQRDLFATLGPAFGDRFDISIDHISVAPAGRRVWAGTLPYVRSFGSVAVGEPLLFINSSGALALAINQGNFAAVHGLQAGADWIVTVRKAQDPATTGPMEKRAEKRAETKAGTRVNSDAGSKADSTAGAKTRDTGVVSRDLWIPSRDTYVPATLTQPAASGEQPLALVLLIHGHGGTRHEARGFTRVAEALAALGIASVRMDFPGCGDSVEPFYRNNLSNMITDVKNVRAFIQQQIAVDPLRTGLLGFSMGGRVAIHLTESDPDLQTLALWAPSAEDGADSLMRYVGGADRWAAMKLQAAQDGFAPFTTFWGQQQQLGPAWFSDLEASRPQTALAAYKGSVMVLYGDQDQVISPAAAAAVTRITTNAQRRERHVIRGADHGLGLFDDDQTSATEVVTRTVEFLASELAR